MSSVLSMQALREHPRDIPTPFEFMLDETPLIMHQVLRHVPGRRLAARATWQGKTVFVKLFFARDGAARLEADCQVRLSVAGIDTPALLYQVQSAEGGVLINEWSDGIDGEQAVRRYGRDALRPMLEAVSALYQAGLQQKDLHMGNFLFAGSGVKVIDAGQIVALPRFRSVAARLDNLALFCAQAPMDTYDDVLGMVSEYVAQQGLPLTGFTRRLKRQSDRRIVRAMKKWRRASSSIDVCRDDAGEWLFDRSLAHGDRDTLAVWLRDPGQLPLLKPSSRVSVYANAQWVVKHYRDTSWKVRLRQRLFQTRADICWQVGWTWDMLGVPTPRPAMLRRCENGESVIAFPRVAGELLSDLMLHQRPRAEKVAPVARQWLARIHAVGFVHGDVKAQNIIIQPDERPCFIDLDGAAFLRSRWRRRARASREMLRFERNWQQFSDTVKE